MNELEEPTLADVFQNINQTNMADLVAGLLAIATVMAEKEVNTKFQHKISVPIPIDVIVTVVATGISYAVKLNSRYGASIIHTIPRGLIVMLLQVAGLISVVVLIVILVLGPLLQPLQKSVLAGIVIANLKGMFLQISNVPILWRQKTDPSTGIWVFTCIACILLGLDVGLLTGVVFELGMVIVRTQLLMRFPELIPRIFRCNSPTYFANINYFKEQLRDANGLAPVELFGVDNEAFEREQDTELVEGEFQQDLEGGASPVTEVEVQVDWTFMLPVNVNVPRVNIHSLVMDFSAVSFLDVMAAKSFKLVHSNSILSFPSVTDETVGRMEAMSFFDEVITRNMLFLSAHDAILFIKLKASSGNLPC
ncbi:hypothetical protein P4O66_014355 [Electrophorus voltai]|uniref:STAS domain-containing protein n=1 Tax=Electrophorus voltai TaxID=2609070 RepID=A0AAD9DQM3_9TELE|nr:hypothetical protein P4O66_014355 [Electrophorus voltai]